MKNAVELPRIVWSMHQSEDGVIPPFPPYAYPDIRRAIEDGEVEIISVEIVPD